MWECVESAADLLGGPELLGCGVHDVNDWDSMVRHGLTFASVQRLVDAFGADVVGSAFDAREQPISQLAEMIRSGWVAARSQRLNQQSGRAIAATALLLAHAQHVFGSAALVKSWLHDPIPALGGRRPLDLIEAGAFQQLDDTLTRIEHGVFA